MNLFDLANLLDNDGNLQNEMMVMAFAATLLSTIPGTTHLGHYFSNLDCLTENANPSVTFDGFKFSIYKFPSIRTSAVLLGNEFDINVGLKRRRRKRRSVLTSERLSILQSL